MGEPYDIWVREVRLYFIPIETRTPIKFGAEVVDRVTCARVWLRVEDRAGRSAEGWGETPLSAQWAWPGELSYADRHRTMAAFCRQLAATWARFPVKGHPLEIGYAFLHRALPDLLASDNGTPHRAAEAMPWLAALVCCSAFDQALYDAYGVLLSRPVYDTFTGDFMSRDLASYLRDARGRADAFAGRHPCDHLRPTTTTLPVWHLVAGLDPLTGADVRADAPQDGEPVTLAEWIERDGLRCLKVKLRGNDAVRDYERLVAVGETAAVKGVDWLTADFNCTVSDPGYVVDILDRLMVEHARIYGMLLYVEQPFPYELERHRIDVHALSARKPLFLDESAHGWEQVRLGRELGWTGVALKTCKTVTSAVLSLCWARHHGMALMVQDLANPMLAMISHAQLAAHAGTMMGVESNGCQFYPAASVPEARVHPGLFRRRNGRIDLSSIVARPGLGYRTNEIVRALPEPEPF